MPLFYTLHNIIPADNYSGVRNTRLFMLGMFLYVVIYILMKNMQLIGKIETEFYQTLFTGLIVLFLADVFVMGWHFKDYYKKSLTGEIKNIFGGKKEDSETENRKIDINTDSNTNSKNIFKKIEQIPSVKQKNPLFNNLKKIEKEIPQQIEKENTQQIEKENTQQIEKENTQQIEKESSSEQKDKEKEKNNSEKSSNFDTLSKLK
jgi:hypothetical protein